MSAPPTFPLPDAAAIARYSVRPDLETLSPSALDEALRVLVARNGYPGALAEDLPGVGVDYAAFASVIRSAARASLGPASGAPAPRGGLGRPTPPPSFLSPESSRSRFDFGGLGAAILAEGSPPAAAEWRPWSEEASRGQGVRGGQRRR